MPYPLFDRSKLKLRPISERKSLMTTKDILPLDIDAPYINPDLETIAKDLIEAKKRGAARILMMGAHVIKEGLTRFVVDLMNREIISHVAMNGGALLHDLELERWGHTSEDVQSTLEDGTFGLYQGVFEEDVHSAIGERGIQETGYRLDMPVTVHISIGQDVMCEMPNYDGAAWGKQSYRDFLNFAESVRHLQGGVVLNIGSQVMGPEIFIKALSMARNVEHQEGRRIDDFTVAVFDIQDIGPLEPMQKEDPRYYCRPLKNLLLRSGGRPYFIHGWHSQTIPALRREVLRLDGQPSRH